MRTLHGARIVILGARRCGWMILVACLALMGSGCWRRDPLPPDDPGRLTITLLSQKFAEGGMIPREFTCDGADRSPPLEWSHVPDASRSLALICDDPDTPMGTFSH